MLKVSKVYAVSDHGFTQMWKTIIFLFYLTDLYINKNK